MQAVSEDTVGNLSLEGELAMFRAIAGQAYQTYQIIVEKSPENLAAMQMAGEYLKTCVRDVALIAEKWSKIRSQTPKVASIDFVDDTMLLVTAALEEKLQMLADHGYNKEHLLDIAGHLERALIVQKRIALGELITGAADEKQSVRQAVADAVVAMAASIPGEQAVITMAEEEMLATEQDAEEDKRVKRKLAAAKARKLAAVREVQLEQADRDAAHHTPQSIPPTQRF